MRSAAKKSAVWKFFKKSLNKEIVTCDLCSKIYKFCGNTTNLRDHLIRQHPRCLNDSVASNRSEVIETNNEDPPELIHKRKKKVIPKMTSPQSVTQVCLSWDNYMGNMSSSVNSLLENQELLDVTFAVEGKFLKAHRFVLSVCSPYFKALFKDCLPFHQPVIFMKDISYETMNDLLKFMYQGEVRIDQEYLAPFVQAAEALQIKGLWVDNCTGNTKTEPVEKQNVCPSVQTEKKQSSPVNTKVKNRHSSFDTDVSSKRTKFMNDESSPLVFDQLPESDANLQFEVELDDRQKVIVSTISDDYDPLDADYEQINVIQNDLIDNMEDIKEGVDNIEDIDAVGDNSEKYNPDDDNDGYSTDSECDGIVDNTIDDMVQEGQGTIYFRRGPKRPVMILGQYEYKVERQTTSTRMSWCCVGKEKYKCKARAVTFRDNVLLKCRQHNHPPTFKGNCTMEPKTVNISSSHKKRKLPGLTY